MSDHDHPLLETFAAERCSAILRTPFPEAVVPAMEAAVEGGFRIVEFTLTCPGALDAISRFAARPELVVGAGTVLTVDEARAAQQAGARFLVSPVADPEVIGFALEQGLLVIPGAYTPAELLGAWRLGAQLVKLFPGPVDGPAYLKAVMGPLPFLRVFPTSGVTEANAAEFLAAGAFGLGFVGCLFEPADLEAGRFGAVRTRAERMVGVSKA